MNTTELVALNYEIDENIVVKSFPRSYEVIFDKNSPQDTINSCLSDKRFLLIDSVVFNCLKDKLKFFEKRTYVACVSENFKTLGGVEKVLEWLTNADISKTDHLIVVGGGITQDVGAFAAACFKRGINWSFIPTTLLAMADSCIGGKTSLNFQNTKNQIGLFSTPQKIILNTEFLTTLPEQDVRSGLGEILKMAILGGKKSLNLYQSMVKKGKVKHFADFSNLIAMSLKIKKDIIEKDEFETLLRKSLNYGHTVGHAIEAITCNQIPHGLAIVLGMLFENQLSYELNLLNMDEKHQLEQLCNELLDFETKNFLRNIDSGKLIEFIKKDKKLEKGGVLFALIESIGKVNFQKISLDFLSRSACFSSSLN